MSEKIGGGWYVAIKLRPAETILKEGNAWHRRARSHRANSIWPPGSFGKLAFTNMRLLYCPPKPIFFEFDRRIDAPYERIRSVTIVANPRTGNGVMSFGRNVVAWEALRVQIDDGAHWFATQYFTQSDQVQLEEWLTLIAEKTGLPTQRERGN